MRPALIMWPDLRHVQEMSKQGQVTNGRGSGNIESIMGPTEKGCDANYPSILLSLSLPFKLEIMLE